MPTGLFHFAWAFAWSSLVFIAFLGWGQTVLLLLKRPPVSIGISVGVGISVALFVGGILNLLRLIVPAVMICFVLGGVALALGGLLGRDRAEPSLEIDAASLAWRDKWPWKRAILGLFIFLFLFRAASTSSILKYNSLDDMGLYLAIPVKIMQTHHLAADPFSERRIESSLGAGYFLQCLEMSCLPLKNIQMSDHFIGFLLLVLLTFALARQLRLPPLLMMIGGILSIALMPVELNLTFAILPSALWLAMVLVAAQDDKSEGQARVSALLVGLLAGSLCSLKSTYFPFAALFCAALLPLMTVKWGWKAALAIWPFVLVGVLIVQGPWMIAMRMTSGTFFYPVLGSGYDFSAYPQFAMPFTASPLTIVRHGLGYYVPLAILAFAQLYYLRRGSGPVFWAATVACLVASLASGIATGNDDNNRYIFPMVLATLLLNYLHFASEINKTPRLVLARVMLAFVVVLQVGKIGLLLPNRQYQTMAHEIVLGIKDQDITSSKTRQEYSDLAAAIPHDGLVLATLQHPYLLNFSDEHILIADYPGCAGLPPGWPIKKTAEDLANYLQGHSIRYLAYSYADNATLDYSRGIADDLANRSVRTQVQYGSYLLADKQYRELRQSRRTLYDDGKSFVIDLATPNAVANTARPVAHPLDVNPQANFANP